MYWYVHNGILMLCLVLFFLSNNCHMQKALSDCPNSVTFMDSSVRKISPEVHEVLILLQLYTGQSVVQLLNQKLSKHSSLSEREVLKIFSDVVVAVGRLHHRTKPIIHRDLKVCCSTQHSMHVHGLHMCIHITALNTACMYMDYPNTTCMYMNYACVYTSQHSTQHGLHMCIHITALNTACMYMDYTCVYTSQHSTQHACTWTTHVYTHHSTQHSMHVHGLHMCIHITAPNTACMYMDYTCVYTSQHPTQHACT